MVAPGRRYGRLRGSGLSDATALARCGPCGARASNQMLRRAISTAKRTVTRGGNKRPLTRETRLENPARLQAGLANSGPRVTTADVYPASLCGVSDRRRRREPRWIFARFHLNVAEALAEAMPVQTPGSGSDGVTVSPSSANRLQLPGETY